MSCAVIERIFKGTTGTIELRRGAWNPQTGGYDFTGRIFTRNLGKILEFVGNGTGDVFHGINTRKPGAKSGKKEDIYEIVCVAADVDFKTTPQEVFECILTEFPLKPTFIIDSGNGRHLYWFFRTPILVNGDPNTVDLIEGIGRSLAKVFHGDHIQNVDRVLRSPGRRNSKYSDDRFCRILSSDGPEYGLDDLTVFAEEGDSARAQKINLGEIPDGLPQKFKELLTKHRIIQATWRGERPDVKDQSGSGFDMAMANILVRYGFTAEEIACILRHMPSGKGRDAGHQYLEHTISKAFASMDNDPDAQQIRAKDEKEDSKTTTQKQGDTPAKDVPSINAGDHDLAQIAQAAWAALLTANNPPILFRHGSLAARIEKDDNGDPIIREVTQDRMRHVLAQVGRWYKLKSGEANQFSALPPLHVVRDILATPDLPLPVLNRIVEAPVFAPDDTLQIKPGYHPASRTFYAPAQGLVIPNVPARPSNGDIETAKTLIVDELLGDFPFTSNSERAHAVAFLLLPFVRDLIYGPTPLHLIEKPSPGTGASLLADVLTFPAIGRTAPVMTEARNEDEWRKRITAKLRGGPSIILVDNIRLRLESSALSAAITSTFWEDRVLGHSDMIRLPVRCGWIATGNNPVVSSEIARRTVRIRLDAKIDRPWLRDKTKYRHPDLKKWATNHRVNLVWAALTFVQAWIAAGRPKAQNTPTMGMFESWAEVMDGIIHVAGIEGFLNNLNEFYEESDAEGSTWRGFVAVWWDRFENREIGVSELWDLISDLDEPLDLGQGTEKSQKTRLGMLLVRMRDRQFDNLRIVKAGERQRAKIWRLLDTTAKDT